MIEKDVVRGLLQPAQAGGYVQTLIEASAERNTYGQVFDQMVMLLEDLVESEEPEHENIDASAYRRYLETLQQYQPEQQASSKEDNPPF